MRDKFCFNANLEAAAEFAVAHDATSVHVEVVAHFPLYFVTMPAPKLTKFHDRVAAADYHC